MGYFQRCPPPQERAGKGSQTQELEVQEKDRGARNLPRLEEGLRTKLDQVAGELRGDLVKVKTHTHLKAVGEQVKFGTPTVWERGCPEPFSLYNPSKT